VIVMISQTLTWLCERRRGDFTVGWVLRRGWPGFANVVLLPKQLELGRSARRASDFPTFYGVVNLLWKFAGGLAGRSPRLHRRPRCTRLCKSTRLTSQVLLVPRPCDIVYAKSCLRL
jgi:hypothetical protein